jgi:Kef-type K+ transport system membrane component KefB
MRKLGLPQVVGALIAGIIIGPMVFGIVGISDVFNIIAEVGVIMIIFSAGVETDLKQIKESGLTSLLVAAGGVLVPLGLGFIISSLFHGGFTVDIMKNIFIGIILTATSISISVETLKEMGKLKPRAGTIIMSAAIIDDVIGIALLSIVLGITNSNVNPWIAILKTIAFFAIAIGVGILLHNLFKYLSKKYPRHRRVPIFALAVCLLYAYSAERFFGVADITGAYLAGIIFSGISTSEYIEKKIDVNTYMIFAPVFFAYIGIKSSFDGLNLNMLWFALAFIAAGISGKIIGAYSMSRLRGLERRESLAIGVGMIARGEVALVVMNKGVTGGVIGQEYLAIVVALVIVSSLLAPIFLRLCFNKDCKTPPLVTQNMPV